jgi:hypothetical protein
MDMCNQMYGTTDLSNTGATRGLTHTGFFSHM